MICGFCKKTGLNKIENENGFTLVELLLVVALTAISVGVTGDVMMSLLRSYSKSTSINEIEQNSNFISLKLEKELRNATSVSVTGSGNVLTIQLSTGTVCYTYLANADPNLSNLYRSTGSCSTASGFEMVATPSLGSTVSGVTISCGTSGACFAVSGVTPQIVTLDLVFKEANQSAVYFKGEVDIKDTVVTRNSY